MKSVLFLLFLLMAFFAKSQTVRLVKDIVPGEKGIFDNGARILGSHNGIAFIQFRHEKDIHYWKTNGTAEGTNFIGLIPNVRALLKVYPFTDGYVIFIRDNNGDDAFWILWGKTGILERLAAKVAPVNEFVLFEGELLYCPDTGLAKLVAIDLVSKTPRIIHTYGPFGVRMLSACDDFVFIVADPPDSEASGSMAFYVYREKKITLQQVVNRGEEHSEGANPLPFRGKIFFWYHPSSNPYQLWVTDGTTDSTYVIFDKLAYESTLDLFYKYDNNFIGKNLILFTGLPSDSCRQCFDLYSLNPVTYKIQNLKITDRPNDTGANYMDFGSDIYFSIKGKLAHTDGTTRGSEIFFNEDITGSNPKCMTEYRGRLYYLAFKLGKDRKVTSTELRSFDPATPEIFSKHDLQGIDPLSMVLLGQRLLFIANDGIHGHELFTYEENASEKK
ncbi:MAG: hypothetical protein WBP41_14240 [Saprospiraceae bacterium]